MAKNGSRELAKGKPSKPFGPNGEGAKKESKRLLKTRSLKQKPSVEVMEEVSVADQSHKRGLVKEKMKSSKPKRESVNEIGGINKEYLGADSFCRVTFRLPKEAAGSAKKVTIVGDFNNWDAEASRMKRLRGGAYETTLELPAGREYRFRYIIDGHRWENDWRADAYKPNIYGCEDSVVIV